MIPPHGAYVISELVVPADPIRVLICIASHLVLCIALLDRN
jgi:hypothetical protein